MCGDNELKQDPLLNEYSSQVEREISSVCEELLGLLKDKLVWRNPMQRRRAKARPHCSHNCHSVWFLDVPDYSS